MKMMRPNFCAASTVRLWPAKAKPALSAEGQPHFAEVILSKQALNPDAKSKV